MNAKTELQKAQEKLFLICGIPPDLVAWALAPRPSEEERAEAEMARLSPVVWYGASRIQ